MDVEIYRTCKTFEAAAGLPVLSSAAEACIPPKPMKKNRVVPKNSSTAASRSARRLDK